MDFRYILLAGSLLPLSVTAQQRPIEQEGAAAQTNLNALTSGGAAVVPRLTSEGTVGSPYLDKRWLTARLKTNSNLPLAPVPLKYDLLGQRLLMKRVDRLNDSLQLNDQPVVGFELEEPATALTPARVRVFRRFLEAPEPRQRVEYVEVLHQGRYALLKRHIKKLNKSDYGQAYGGSRNYDEILDSNQYFLLRPDKKLVPLKLTLKMLQAAAPELALKTAPGASAASTDAEWAAVLAAAEAK